jgi:hypothetical protein
MQTVRTTCRFEEDEKVACCCCCLLLIGGFCCADQVQVAESSTQQAHLHAHYVRNRYGKCQVCVQLGERRAAESIARSVGILRPSNWRSTGNERLGHTKKERRRRKNKKNEKAKKRKKKKKKKRKKRKEKRRKTRKRKRREKNDGQRRRGRKIRKRRKNKQFFHGKCCITK